MILVDTNVWSELLKRVRSETVLNWLRANTPDLVLSSIVLGELKFFVEKQDGGRRKAQMQESLAAIVASVGERFVGFGAVEATHYAELMASMRRFGTSLPQVDGWIAAQAKAHDMQIATRNVADFRPTGLTLINPWDG